MPGVRIRHRTERNAMFTLVAGDRPYPEPWQCPAPPTGCGGIHEFKTYHLRLDETGAVIVSEEIWAKLQRIPLQPFSLANEVKEPPTQTISMPALLARPAPINPEPVHQSVLNARRERFLEELRRA